MRNRPAVRNYCAGVFVAACLVAAALAGTTNFAYAKAHPLTFAFLVAGVMLGELLPVKIPHRGGDEEITLSTSFTMALLLAAGLGPALIAQSCASVVQDLIARKPWWRIRFNVGQYALSIAAALIVMWLLGATSSYGTARPFTSAELPAVLLAAAAFFIVNTGLVNVAVALYQGVPIGQYFRNNLFFVVVTSTVLLFLAPIVVAATAYSVALLPLFAAPMLAIYHAGRQAVSSEYAARHDSLTGLPNRTAFREAVEDAICEPGRRFCILLMDLDRFKEVNDTLGHRHGDLLLQQVGERLREQVGGSDRIARLGGDEFVILTDIRNSEESLQSAALVADWLRAPFDLDQIVVDAQASVGIALFPDDGRDIETLLQKADVAMYRAKETRTGAALYDERHDHHSPAKLALTADLRRAIDTNEIVVWYQPELDLRTNQVSALEALVRWEHPDLGLLMPASFIGVAEHTNLIKPLTQRVLEIALRQVAEWRAMDIDVAIAVNISTRVLVDQDCVRCVRTALENIGVAPTLLKLEVTESTLMADPVAARSVLRELNELGITIAIDDFGTGYSSLSYLAHLPVSEVKIDRSFVARMTPGSREAIIVNSTIDLGRHLGLRTIAEGVEDPALLPKLEALGCHVAQGYAISRPLPGQDATRWLLASQRPVRIRRTLVDAA